MNKALRTASDLLDCVLRHAGVSEAIWILSNDDVVLTDDLEHFDFVSRNPEMFGITDYRTQKDINVLALQNNNIRVRKYNRFLGIDGYRYDTETLKRLQRLIPSEMRYGINEVFWEHEGTGKDIIPMKLFMGADTIEDLENLK